MSMVLQLALDVPDGLPSAEWLIQDARDRLREGHTPDDLRLQWSHAWGGLTEAVAPIPVHAKWLGLDEKSIYSARTRVRPDGQRLWPEPEPGHIVGKTMLWRFSAVALNRAQAGGRGWNFRTGAKDANVGSA